MILKLKVRHCSAALDVPKLPTTFKIPGSNLWKQVPFSAVVCPAVLFCCTHFLINCTAILSFLYRAISNFILPWGRILGRNWDKSLKSFPPCYSQSLMYFTPPPPPLEQELFDTDCMRKPQIWELSRLWPEASTKLDVQEFGLSSNDQFLFYNW